MEIKLKNIKYKNIFDELNITMKDSEITAIVGKNNSGKTSIMNMIFGIETNFSGEIKIGRSTINKKTALDIRKKIAYIRQDYEQDLFNTNALDDIKYGISSVDEEKLNELLKSFKLNKNILKKCYTDLSSSEIKKILLIKLFLSNKKILLIDDVTNGLDNKSVSTLIKILKREKREGKIIILSSTNSEFLLSIADNFIILDNKNLKIEGDKYSVFTNEELLKNAEMDVPNTLKFKMLAQKKGIKLMYRDNTNDLMKDIYRNVK